MLTTIPVLSGARGSSAWGSGAWQQASHFPLVSSCQTRFEDSIRVGAADSSGAGMLLIPHAGAAWGPDESQKRCKWGRKGKALEKEAFGLAKCLG